VEGPVGHIEVAGLQAQHRVEPRADLHPAGGQIPVPHARVRGGHREIVALLGHAQGLGHRPLLLERLKQLLTLAEEGVDKVGDLAELVPSPKQRHDGLSVRRLQCPRDPAEWVGHPHDQDVRDGAQQPQRQSAAHQRTGPRPIAEQTHCPRGDSSFERRHAPPTMVTQRVQRRHRRERRSAGHLRAGARAHHARRPRGALDGGAWLRSALSVRSEEVHLTTQGLRHIPQHVLGHDAPREQPPDGRRITPGRRGWLDTPIPDLEDRRFESQVEVTRLLALAQVTKRLTVERQIGRRRRRARTRGDRRMGGIVYPRGIDAARLQRRPQSLDQALGRPAADEGLHVAAPAAVRRKCGCACAGQLQNALEGPLRLPLPSPTDHRHRAGDARLDNDESADKGEQEERSREPEPGVDPHRPVRSPRRHAQPPVPLAGAPDFSSSVPHGRRGTLPHGAPRSGRAWPRATFAEVLALRWPRVAAADTPRPRGVGREMVTPARSGEWPAGGRGNHRGEGEAE